MSLWTAMFRPTLINIGLQWVSNKVLGKNEVIKEKDDSGRTSKEIGFGCSGSCS